MDPERLFLRTLAVTANAARRYVGRPSLTEWLSAQIQNAFEQLRRDDLLAVFSRESVEADERTDYAYIVDVLGVSTEHARHAALVFNALPERIRRCWWAAAIDGVGIEQVSARGLGSVECVQGALRRAVRALATLSDPEVRLQSEEDSDE
jgi:hypothetical protein